MTTHMLILSLDFGFLIVLKNRLKTRCDKADKPKLKLTIKTGTAGTHGHDRIVSPNRIDNTFQVLLLFLPLFVMLLLDSKAGEGRVTNIKQEGSESKVLMTILEFNCTDGSSVQYLTETLETLQDN